MKKFLLTTIMYKGQVYKLYTYDPAVLTMGPVELQILIAKAKLEFFKSHK